MKISEATLSGALIIEPDDFEDSRGFLFESWKNNGYSGLGLKAEIVQDNISYSRKGMLRGLHFQNPQAQAKLVTVLQGEVLDVIVDLRCDSPTFGKWEGVVLSGKNKRQLYIPEGFAHGFEVTGDDALFFYKSSAFCSRENEKTLLWEDSDLAITWPIDPPSLSVKDAHGRSLKEFARKELFDVPLPISHQELQRRRMSRLVECPRALAFCRHTVGKIVE